jgi:hypothetical protein
MKNSSVLRSAVVLALAFGSLASSAQSTANLSIKVPFDFMVGITMFPAGEYTVKPVSRQKYLLAAQHGAEFVVVNTRPALVRSSFRAGGLVFVNDGHHYRLQEVKMWLLAAKDWQKFPRAASLFGSPRLMHLEIAPQIIRTGREY